MARLNKKDYVNLLNFTEAISSLKASNYYGSILKQLENSWGWHDTFVVVKGPNRPLFQNNPTQVFTYSLSMKKAVISRCGEKFPNDKVLVQEICKSKAYNNWDGLMLTEKLTAQQRSESTFIATLRKLGFSSAIIMSLHSNPDISIVICLREEKHESEELCQKIRDILANSVSNWVFMKNCATYSACMKEISYTENMGYAILDDDLQCLDENSMFRKLCLDLLPERTNFYSIAKRMVKDGIKSLSFDSCTVELKPVIYSHAEIPYTNYLLIIRRHLRDGVAEIDVKRAKKLGLTNKEIEIAQLLSFGKTAAQIADEMNVTRNTIKVHMTNIYKRLRVTNKMEMLAKLRR